MSDDRYRIGTYINQFGETKWQIEHYCDLEDHKRWILHSQDYNDEDAAMKEIKIRRKIASHLPNWKEV